MTTTLNYTTATQLLEQGKNKDAYAAFLTVIALTTEELHRVKFVHQTLVSTPTQYEDSIYLLRSTLDQLEKIAIHKLPGAISANDKKIIKSPPPVPPKPTNMKPIIPPKPKKTIPPSISTNSLRRTRGSSVSFAEGPDLQQTAIIENDTVCIVKQIEEEDDDDDDDVVIDFSTVKSNKRPSTVNTTLTIPRAVRGRSKSWVIQSDSMSKRDSIDVLLETVVDPSNLVPAQTNTGDSLAIPNTSQSDYVPNIPAPPLLATHRRLQQRLEDLQLDLKLCSSQGEGLLKSESTHKVTCAKQTLEKVRTLYMSAMTIPNFLQFPPHLIAYQLTLIESSIFRAIPRQALLSHSARTPHRKIVASTDFFNFMTRSIEHSILLPQEASKRAGAIHRWIKIATKLLALNNYQTLKAIISALGTPPVQRLRRTWECIPKKRIARLELLNTLMSEADNYRRYREHMGLEKKRLWAKPVVPFLGVFIHDITYLSAAAKGKTDDPRVQDVLNSVQLLQHAPEYPQLPPVSYTNLTTKKHLFRPSLHFGSSSTKNTNRNTTAALMGEDQRQETEIELEQQLIMQYILMRPWVSEKTIDALSTLREPPKSKSTTSPTSANGFNSSLMSSPSTGRPGSGFMISPSVSSSTNGTLYTNASAVTASPLLPSQNSSSASLLGNASSFMRFNSTHSNSSSTLDSESPSQVIPSTPNEESKRSLSGFWPFKKSVDRTNTVDSVVFIPQEQNWSEEDDDDEDDEIIDTTQNFQHGQLLQREGSVSPRGHNRSISLPNKPSTLISEIYK